MTDIHRVTANSSIGRDGHWQVLLPPLTSIIGQQIRQTVLLGILILSFTVPAHASGNWIQVRGGAWTVSEGDIVRMAKQIESAAAGARGGKGATKAISTYFIQFRGIRPSGGRAVELRGSCEVDGRSPEKLRESFFNILDGGDCYFCAIWDAKARKFKNFHFNGVA